MRCCAPGSSRARPLLNKAGKTCRASMGSGSVQTAGWRSCVWPHSHALASHIGGTRWSSVAVFLASVCCSWACSLSVHHLSSFPLRVRAQSVALFRVPGASVALSEAFLGVSPQPPYLPMQGPLGFPCLLVEPFDGGDGTRPAQRATVRTVGDLPEATVTVLPEAIAVGRRCVAP